ncbi:hypothetical protein [Christiangramia crocea]|uniref:Uncharacterized protein n=1 Tax=Christiangramia crocea TaxID=2904124 RepID=A0A9X1UV87_9FLAO|nr:hypothetical protein [Gramella crocea]MCG9971007.1 hypothetical protein [Gramella crocea]
MRFTPHPSGILIGRTYKIKGWKPSLFKTAEPETRIEVLRSWNETDDIINERLVTA